MKTAIICILLTLLVCTGYGQKKPQTVIAFGSCNDENKSQEMWKEVLAQRPDVWIWGGDNIYADDNESLEKMKARYEKQKSNTDYQQLLKTSFVTGTWDDHDYGINDGGKFFGKKDGSKALFVDFVGFEKNNPIRQHSGIYNSVVIGNDNQKVKIINLDTRSFRDTIIRISYLDSITNKKGWMYQSNPTGDVLGEEQWAWLAEELRDNTPQLFIINSSIQVLSEDHRFEKWANLPLARRRLLNLLAASKKRVLIISGDRHISELSKKQLPELNYPLFDFTSSGMTHTWSEIWKEDNRHRVGELVIQKTFGLITIDWSGRLRKVILQAKGLGGTIYLQHVIEF